MLCECGEHEATVHETVIINGKPVEKHLCEFCAQKLGLVQFSQHTPLQELVKHFVQDVAEPEQETKSTCPACSLTWSQFKQTGLLGCAVCYKTFEDRLGPLIERAHQGATHHVGKIPRGALERSRQAGADRLESILGDTEVRLRRMEEIRKQLSDAVQAEQFERAAALRDELDRLGQVESHDDGD